MFEPSGLVCDYEFEPAGVCCKKMAFSVALPSNKIFDIHFVGGCKGNLAALAKMMDGMDAEKICDMFLGNKCGAKSTSCMDQFAQFIKEEVLLNYSANELAEKIEEKDAD